MSRYLTAEDLAKDDPPSDIPVLCSWCSDQLGKDIPAVRFYKMGFRRQVGTVLSPRCEEHSPSQYRGELSLEEGKKILWERIRRELVDDAMEM